MAKYSPSGNLGAQRDAESSKFFGRKIKGAGVGSAAPFSPMSKVQLAQTEAIVGSLPKGDNTTGGVVGGLSDSGNYQGVKAGKG